MSADDLTILTYRRDEMYVWEIYRTGSLHPIKHSGPLFKTDEDARRAAEHARDSMLEWRAKGRPRQGVRIRKSRPRG